MHARTMQVVLATVVLGAIVTGVMYGRADQRQSEQKALKASASAAATLPESDGHRTAPDAPIESSAGSNAEPIASSRPLAPEDVARLIAATNSGDASTRADAILALANAPKDAAIPALRRVVEGGEPTIDRPLALRALRDLALDQGDDDGAIRNVVREAIYHGEDETVVQSAELALEIIEESEMQ